LSAAALSFASLASFSAFSAASFAFLASPFALFSNSAASPDDGGLVLASFL
jgi:hypothetical protein